MATSEEDPKAGAAAGDAAPGGAGSKTRVVIVPGNGGGDVWDSNW